MMQRYFGGAVCYHGRVMVLLIGLDVYKHCVPTRTWDRACQEQHRWSAAMASGQTDVGYMECLSQVYYKACAVTQGLEYKRHPIPLSRLHWPQLCSLANIYVCITC